MSYLPFLARNRGGSFAATSSGGAVASLFGNCLQFDGTNDHALREDFVSPATNISWSFWFQQLEHSDDYPFGQDDNFAVQFYKVGASETHQRVVVRQWFNDGSYNQHYYNATGERVYSTWDEDQPWVFVCSTWDGSDHVSYVKWNDGTTEQAHTKTSSISKTLDAVTGDIIVGATGSWGTGTGGTSKGINGKVDDVRIYDVALSSSNVTSIYNEGSGDFSSVTRESDLHAWWKLDESSGTTASDEINDMDLTLTNMDGDTDWVASK